MVCTWPRKFWTRDTSPSARRNSPSPARQRPSERRDMNDPIQEKSPKPPGLLPKNVQSWMLVSIALVMVLIMWLTGGKKPQTTPRTNGPAEPVQAPLEVNEAKIAELQNRIEDLQREQLVAQNALAQQGRPLGTLPPGADAAPPSFQGSSAEPVEDPIQVERKK